MASFSRQFVPPLSVCFLRPLAFPTLTIWSCSFDPAFQLLQEAGAIETTMEYTRSKQMYSSLKPRALLSHRNAARQ